MPWTLFFVPDPMLWLGARRDRLRWRTTFGGTACASNSDPFFLLWAIVYDDLNRPVRPIMRIVGGYISNGILCPQLVRDLFCQRRKLGRRRREVGLAPGL